MSLFSVEDLSVGYDQTFILNHLSFSVENHEIIGIIGANGSGKTTLIKALCRLLPSKGTVAINGLDIHPLSQKEFSKKVGYIPQRSGINIDISVLDMVLAGFNAYLGLVQPPTREMREKALNAISAVGLAGMENKNYQHLSEGQKQLCVFARTILANRSILLLDEPESSLDFNFRHRIFEHLRKWTSEDNRAALIATHDPSLSLNYCDKLLLLHKNGYDMIDLSHDSIETIESGLNKIFTSVSLQTATNSKGQKLFFIVKE